MAFQKLSLVSPRKFFRDLYSRPFLITLGSAAGDKNINDQPTKAEVTPGGSPGSHWSTFQTRRGNESAQDSRVRAGSRQRGARKHRHTADSAAGGGQGAPPSQVTLTQASGALWPFARRQRQQPPVRIRAWLSGSAVNPSDSVCVELQRDRPARARLPLPPSACEE